MRFVGQLTGLAWLIAVSTCVALPMGKWAHDRKVHSPRPVVPGDPKPPVRMWMVMGAGFWTLGVIAIVVVTNVVDGARFCDVTKVTKPELVTKESTQTATGPSAGGTTGTTTVASSGSSEKQTTTPKSTETTSNCQGVSVAQAALLLVPGLLFFAPALTGIDIAGLFKLSFREVQTKLDQQREVVERVAASVQVLQQTVVSQRINVQVFADSGQAVRQGNQEADAEEVHDIAAVLPGEAL